jgi:Domain of unknown function (DUF4286)
MPQVIYNVTINVDDDIHQDWLEWMKKIHIPEVMQTGLFEGFRVLRVITPLGEEDPGTTYAIQYTLSDIKHFLAYTEQYAKELREKAHKRYGEKVVAFRTLLEVVD